MFADMNKLAFKTIHKSPVNQFLKRYHEAQTYKGEATDYVLLGVKK